jgi:hypothetical protein
MLGIKLGHAGGHPLGREPGAGGLVTVKWPQLQLLEA